MKHANLDSIISAHRKKWEKTKTFDCFIGNLISAHDFWKATIIISTVRNQLK